MANTKRNQRPQLSLDGVRRLAIAAARSVDPNLEVIAATRAGGENSSEVLVRLTDCASEPCRMLLRVDRTADEDTLVPTIRARLRAYVEAEHRRGSDERGGRN